MTDCARYHSKLRLDGHGRPTGQGDRDVDKAMRNRKGVIEIGSR